MILITVKAQNYKALTGKGEEDPKEYTLVELADIPAPPNGFVNGDFKIWQRGESFTINGDEAFHYTADMWCVYAATGQNITVKKTSDGLTFSGTSAIMQRIKPLKVGQKYIFLAKVDDDIKTLQLTGGTYTENSFLKYNKSGSYEQFQIKSNGNTKVGNARLWKGDIVYPIIEEDYSIALDRCYRYVQKIGFPMILLKYSSHQYVGFNFYKEMENTPTIESYIINKDDETALNDITFTIGKGGVGRLRSASYDNAYLIFYTVIATCEPL